jgi:hypothetical protein
VRALWLSVIVLFHIGISGVQNPAEAGEREFIVKPASTCAVVFCKNTVVLYYYPEKYIYPFGGLSNSIFLIANPLQIHICGECFEYSDRIIWRKYMRSDQRMHWVAGNVRNGSRHQAPALANQHPNIINDGRRFAQINYGVAHPFRVRSLGRLSPHKDIRSFKSGQYRSALFGDFDRPLHMTGMFLRGLPQSIGRTPQSEGERGDCESLENELRVMVSFDRVYNRREDDPDYRSKVIAGILFMIGLVAVIVVCVRMDRAVRQFYPPKTSGQNASDTEDR